VRGPTISGPTLVVNALGVRCQKERLRVHQGFYDEYGLLVVVALTEKPIIGRRDGIRSI
jgi:hypothetical protein